jgi:hypothetical protein
MGSTDEAWLSGLLLVLFGLAFVLRIKFPNPSRAAETTVLISLTVLFFSFCSLFLGEGKPLTEDVRRVTTTQRNIRQ